MLYRNLLALFSGQNKGEAAGGSRFLHNAGTYLPVYTVLHPTAMKTQNLSLIWDYYISA
jgi:hypothetical protein